MKYEKAIEAINNVSSMPPEQALETLVNCAKKSNALAAARAVKAMAHLNHTAVVPSLLDLYKWLEEDPIKRDRGCDIRLAIVEAFGETGSRQAIEILRKAVRTVQIVRLGPSPEDIAINLRAAAAVVLAHIDSDALYELALLLFDEEPVVPTIPLNRMFVKAPVRKAAAHAIGVLGSPDGIPLLAVKLKFPGEEVPDVLAECLESLIAMRPSYVMEAAKPYLMGKDDYLSVITALSLAENLRANALEPLLEALEYVQDEAKEAIVVAISVIRGSGIRRILFDFLDSKNPFVRRGAVKGIKSYMDDAVMEKLRIMRDTDPDKIVRQEADLD
ncbi:MAG: HEAT repeat domain-containing protein [Firmicutes bacterium]|nr:HEAT repeat domain-containing protein [Bacillota bacterium]